ADVDFRAAGFAVMRVCVAVLFEGGGADVRQEASLPVDLNVGFTGDHQAYFTDADFDVGIGAGHSEISGKVELGAPDSASQVHGLDLSITETVNDQLTDAAFHIKGLQSLAGRLVERDLGSSDTAAQVHAANLQ